MNLETMLNNTGDSDTLLKYINELTKKYSLAATLDEEKLQELGFTSEDILCISTESGLEEAISAAERNNVTDVLLSGSSFIQSASNTIFQSLTERKMKEELIKNIFTIEHQIMNLQEYTSFLERELNSLTTTQNKRQEYYSDKIINLRNQVADYESDVGELKENATETEIDNWSDIIENIKTLDKKINENETKIEKYTSIISDKYKNLEPNLLLSKSELANLKQQLKEINDKFKELVRG